MRNQVSYPRVRAPRRAHKILPALGGAVVSLTTAGLLIQPFLADAAGTAPQPAAEMAAAESASVEAAAEEPAAIGLRGSVIADIGPYEPQGFAPRRAVAAQALFVSRAEAAPRIAEAPLPPARPAAEPEKTAALAAPAPTPAIEAVGAPTPPRRPAELSVALRPEPPKEQSTEMARTDAARTEPAAPPASRARMARTTVVPAATTARPGFFERLFGSAPQAQPSREAMAYAPSTDTGGLFGGLRSAVAPVNLAARYDRYTAVYDISAHVVYMPDGSRLEAHSGLREHLDDPRYVHVRMRGATPPHLYTLTPREALFHGVEALRLNPVGGGGAIFGRAGLLAHTYMLGPNGDSNGCVSFRDYNAFLQAYKRGDVRRLAVVARL